MKAIKAEREHLAGIARLEALCFSEPWSEKALELLLSDTALGLVCLDDGGVPVSYVGMITVLDEGQITNVATHPAYRRQGLASTLLTALVLEAKARSLKTLSLEVRESNLAAVRLYESHGFSVGGKRHSFYKNPREDALVMICNL